mmetsp:Transcript_6706/g.21115  ORF Transcript_6706/g.21115 Transcript_6706/m.21115 type:complete len:288 (+) Transcript_6706:295-1158(+)
MAVRRFRPRTRAQRLAARSLPWPSRVHPCVVLRFSELPDVASGLRVCKTWRDQAEAIFCEIASVEGLAEGAGSWRDAVRQDATLRWVEAPRWVAVSSFVMDETLSATYTRAVEPNVWLGFDTARIDNRSQDDFHILGPGRRLGWAPPHEQAWRVLLEGAGKIVGCGFALVGAADPLFVLHACMVNTSGRMYCGADWLETVPTRRFDSRNSTLSVRVRAVSTTGARDRADALILSIRVLLPGGGGYELVHAHKTSLTELGLAGRRDLRLAPIARTYHLGVATLLREPL